MEVRPAALFGGDVAGVAEASHAFDPVVPETVGLREAVGVVGAEEGVEPEEGAQDGGLVVLEVGAGEVAVEVRGEDLSVGVGEAGQGEAVGAA